MWKRTSTLACLLLSALAGYAQNITGSISGRGNFVKLTQGKLCGPSQPQNFVCPPPVPKPIH